LAPLLYNGGIIAGGLLLAPYLTVGVEGFAWGALVGAVAGPFLAPLLYARGRVRMGVRVAPLDRVFLGYLLIAAPLMFGQTLLTVDEWYQRWFGALLGAGAVSHLSYARRLMQVPVAVVGQAIAAAALPTLSRLFAEHRQVELNRLVLRTLQASLALAVLTAAVCYALAQPIVRLVYQHGAFTAADSAEVSAILALLCFAVPAWIAQQIIARAFYARADTLRPMLLGTVVAIASIPLYLELGRSHGVRGLAIASAIGMTVSAVATLIWARWLHGAPTLFRLFGTSARAALIAVPAALLVRWLFGNPPSSTSSALLTVMSGTALFTLLAGGGTLLIGDDAMREMLRRLGRRMRRT
jgi:putative peptidoglycan lipid II flippase